MKSIFVPDALPLDAFETKMAARYSKHQEPRAIMVPVWVLAPVKALSLKC